VIFSYRFSLAIIVLILFNCSCCLSQFTYELAFGKEDIVVWNENRLLQWSDFQGEMIPYQG
jgi:hypothetical protein